MPILYRDCALLGIPKNMEFLLRRCRISSKGTGALPSLWTSLAMNPPVRIAPGPCFAQGEAKRVISATVAAASTLLRFPEDHAHNAALCSCWRLTAAAYLLPRFPCMGACQGVSAGRRILFLRRFLNRATTLYRVGPWTRTMMQSCADRQRSSQVADPFSLAALKAKETRRDSATSNHHWRPSSADGPGQKNGGCL